MFLFVRSGTGIAFKVQHPWQGQSTTLLKRNNPFFYLLTYFFQPSFMSLFLMMFFHVLIFSRICMCWLLSDHVATYNIYLFICINVATFYALFNMYQRRYLSCLKFMFVDLSTPHLFTHDYHCCYLSVFMRDSDRAWWFQIRKWLNRFWEVTSTNSKTEQWVC